MSEDENDWWDADVEETLSRFCLSEAEYREAREALKRERAAARARAYQAVFLGPRDDEEDGR